ncbi:SAGA complex subunit Sgf73 [Dimargaris xerosporica]|nr:SAGA complex subunit Sgf73 [Dimargaris xerosporica]
MQEPNDYALTEDENLLIQQMVDGIEALAEGPGGIPSTAHHSPTILSVFADQGDWAPLANTGLTPNGSTAAATPASDDPPKATSYKDLERLFREADGIDQWAPLRPDPNQPAAVTRNLNAEYLDHLGIQPLEQSPTVVRCEHCQRPISRAALANHLKRSCPNYQPPPADSTTPNGTALASQLALGSGALDGEEELLNSGSVLVLNPQDQPLTNIKPSKAAKNGEPQPRAKTKKVGKLANHANQLSPKSSENDDNKRPASSEPGHGPGPTALQDVNDPMASPPEKKAKVKRDKKPMPKTPNKNTTRAKGPIDLDKQCGVLGPNNQPCARSLTCKTHSMGAKRAVVGRSQLYDVLLKSHLAKSRSAAAAQKNASMHNANGTNPGDSDSIGLTKQEEAEELAMTSDEELDLVMRALQHNKPRPLAIRTTRLVRRRHQYLRVRDMLLDALKPSTESQLLINTFGNATNDL